jgi:acetylglutamate kinase
MTTTTAPSVRERTRAKSRVLLEALPYIREHAGQVVVVKLGGAAMDDPALLGSFAEDVSLLRLVGIRPVVLHGGGRQVSELSDRLGLTTEFRGGLRVTDGDTLRVAKMVLVGDINKRIVSVLNRAGTRAVGLCGDDGDLLLAEKHAPNGDDLGFVGEVTGVNTELLDHLMEIAVPVIASIATDGAGQSYNVNADPAAAAVAIALGAAKLVMLTDVPGVMVDGEQIAELTANEADDLLASGAAGGGMGPKLRAAADAVRAGVGRAHVIDGRVEHSLVLELFTPEGIGTMVCRDEVPPS